MTQAAVKAHGEAEPLTEVRARTQGLGVRYGAEAHIALPDLTVRAGEELAVVGPSGSGKTTLLHLLAGLLRPTEGSVWVAGQDLTVMTTGTRERFRARHVGLVFQDFHLIDGYTALENVVVALAAAGMSLPGAGRRAKMLLQELGLGHRLNHLPKHLSTGERQRVAIARATAAEPVLLLADEPTANLDRGRAEVALTLLRDVAAKAGAALVVSTHDPAVKASFARQLELT